MHRSFHRTRRLRGWLRACLGPAAIAAVVSCSAGCESWRTPQIDNPVLGPPPPRLSWDEAPSDEQKFAGVAQVSSTDSGDATAGSEGSHPPLAGHALVSLSERAPISDFAVMAIVNGEPILAGEILAPFRPHFVQMREEGLSEREIEQVKLAAMQRHIGQRIETTLLVQSLRLMLKSEQLESMEEMLEKEWQTKLQEVMAGKEVGSTAELERVLAEEGTSLAEFEHDFKNKQLALLYLGMKTGEQAKVIGRRDIVEYYSENIDKYEFSARARFQLLMTTFEGNGGKEPARAKIETALAEINAGDAFGDVVQRHSDGPRAKDGGQHDWFRPGDFNSDEVDTALFELPVNEVSPVYEMPKGFVVVKVTEREEAGRIPLADVQDRIRRTLQEQHRAATVAAVFEELRAKAVVTTYLE